MQFFLDIATGSICIIHLSFCETTSGPLVIAAPVPFLEICYKGLAQMSNNPVLPAATPQSLDRMKTNVLPVRHLVTSGSERVAPLHVANSMNLAKQGGNGKHERK